MKPAQVLAAERRSEKQSAIHKNLSLLPRERSNCTSAQMLRIDCWRKFAVLYCCRSNFLFTHQRVSELAPETLALEPTV